MGEGPDRSTVYVGPGCEHVFVVVPAVIIVALVGSIVVTVVGTTWWQVVVVGLLSAGTGLLAWLGIWELFVRLHPRGSTVKWFAVPFGPPIVSLVVVVVYVRAIQGGEPVLTLALVVAIVSAAWALWYLGRWNMSRRG